MTTTAVRALLAALMARDDSTGKHSESVAELVWMTAREMGLSGTDAADAAHIGLVHDVGKLAIPDAILHKRGPLTEREWQVMRRHPEIGERIVASVEALVHLAPAVRAEHERWDGGGYPDGLSAEAIPPASRIVLACDAYEAMISDRPYRAALESDDAILELEAHAGRQFDPAVVSALIGVVRRRGDACKARGAATRRPSSSSAAPRWLR